MVGKPCQIEDCKNRISQRIGALDLYACSAHIHAWHRYGDVHIERRPRAPDGTDPGLCVNCGEKPAIVNTDKLCSGCKNRLRSHGDPNAGGRRRYHVPPGTLCEAEGEDCAELAVRSMVVDDVRLFLCNGCRIYYMRYGTFVRKHARPTPQAGRPCGYPGCARKSYARGYCKTHVKSLYPQPEYPESEQVRERFRFFGGRCYMCGQDRLKIEARNGRMVREHVIERNRKPELATFAANMRPACNVCNSIKRLQPLKKEWTRLPQMRKGWLP